MVNVLKSIAMGMLAIMMFLTLTDVLLRKFINRPITGAYELIEFMMAILVPFSVLYCAHQKAHINVDIIVGRLSEGSQRLIACVTYLITFIFFLLMTWQMFRYISDEFQSKLTSSVLLIPVYPFIATFAVGFAVLCLVLLVDYLYILSEVLLKWTRA